ncbi:MAG: hypothetical protein EBU70_13000, partial [Actinobacteria bacterium]|nr:hypothetical protein [Actinomycetota bacterium]
LGGVRIPRFIPAETGTYTVRVSRVIGEYDVAVLRGVGVPDALLVSLANDTGRDAADRITSDGRISVSGVEAGAVVQFSVDGGNVWTSSFQATEGVNSVLVRQVDAGGATSEAARIAFTLDTSRPAAPAAGLVSDTGAKKFDGVTGLASLTTVAPIAALFHTGVDDAGKPAANWTTDLHYALVSVPGGTLRTRVATNASGYPIGQWFPDNGTSAWIGPDNNWWLDAPAGYFVYRTTFDLQGLPAAGARIDGLWSTDDSGVDIVVNGRSTGAWTNWGQFQNGFMPFTIDSGLVDGTNTIDFVVYNAGGPTGLRVEMTGSVSTLESGAAVEYSADGGATWAPSYATVEGKNALLVRQIDVAGNVSDPFTVAFTLDGTAPQAPGVSLANDTGSSDADVVTSDGSLALSGIESGATVAYSVDGGITWKGFFRAVEGKNTLLVRQIDEAGNVGPAT